MNDSNLRHFTSDQSHDAAVENGRKGGIAAGKARRARADQEHIARMLLEAEAPPKMRAKVAALAGDDESMQTNAAVVVAGAFAAAAGGNIKAAQYLHDLTESADKRDNEEATDYRMSPLDITSDFVEPYRLCHKVFAGESTVREIISKGGRGSIKSSFWARIAKETIKRNPDAHVVFTRRYKTDLRGSVFTQFEKVVQQDGELDEWEFTTSPMQAKYIKTGQLVIFVGCDKPISLKSYNMPFGSVYMLIHEESDEMAGVEQMDSVEDTFLRGDNPSLDVKVFNPPQSAQNFMNEYTVEKETDPATYICHSFYDHVPVEWLGQRFYDRAEWFKKNKPQYFSNNYLGEVTGTGGELFDNVSYETITDDRLAELETLQTYQGIDWGYEHPQVFSRVVFDRETDTLYVLAESYKQRCKMQAFLRPLDKYKGGETICDSAEPDKIADACDYGWNCIGATKRWKGGGRDYAWEWLRNRTRIVVDKDRTPNIAKEFRTLEFEKLRDGRFSSAYPRVGEDGIMATIYALNREIMSYKDIDEYQDYTYVEGDEDE